MPAPVVKTLVTHVDERGFLTELLRCDDPFYKQFGQAYVSAIHPGVVKGFHKHTKQTEHICCLSGSVKLVLVDGRHGGWEFYEYSLSPLSPKMVVVQPGVWYGWRGDGVDTSLLINFASHVFDPTDGERIDPHDNDLFYYDWNVKHR